MPTKLDLTLANHAGIAQTLRTHIERFEQSRRSSVQLTLQDWDTIWKDLVNIGIYKRGADVSEVGTTWMGSLISMEALRPFKRLEISQIGGQRNFVPAAWATTSLVGDERVLAIPFMTDVRVIYYWRDMLEQAGVPEEKAFTSFESMEETLSRLKSVLPTPWAFSADASTHDSLYNSLSWVWAVGGDYISPDGRKTQFTTPEVHKALHTFFGLSRHMPWEGQPMSDGGALRLFRERKVAAILGGPWVPFNLRTLAESEELLPRLGISLAPGPSFVGGMNLVVWQHSRYPQECVELIRHLVTPQAQVDYCPRIGMMPARLEALADSFYAGDPYYQVLAEALQKGRAATRFSLWGMVEDKLTATFAQIWRDIFSQPGADLDDILAKHLDALARRLDITLGG